MHRKLPYTFVKISLYIPHPPTTWTHVETVQHLTVFEASCWNPNCSAVDSSSHTLWTSQKSIFQQISLTGVFAVRRILIKPDTEEEGTYLFTLLHSANSIHIHICLSFKCITSRFFDCFTANVSVTKTKNTWLFLYFILSLTEVNEQPFCCNFAHVLIDVY